MAKYRKKPVVIEAFLLGRDEHPMWFISNPDCAVVKRAQGLAVQAYIKTLEGTMTANHGDWIIRGVKGEIYPCKPDIFEATYEPAETKLERPTIAELEQILNEPVGDVTINPDGSITKNAP